MHNILHFFTISAKADKIFEAIATSEGLNNWWTLRSQGAPELGSAYQFYFTPEYDWWAEVIEIIPNKMIEWKMTKADEDWTGTKLKFELEQREEHVAVHFSHIGWAATNEHFRRTNYCWALLFKGLKDYVEQGVILPFEERS